MSARDLILPDSAFAQALESLDSRVSAVEARAMWPGAAHSQVSAVGGTSPWQYYLAGGYPAAGATPFMSLSVDPGRWVFFTMTQVQVVVGSDHGGPAEGEVGIIFSATDGVVTTSRTLSGRQLGGGFGATWTFTSAIEFTSKLPETASLSFFYGLTPNAADPYGAGSWTRATLIAFPG